MKAGQESDSPFQWALSRTFLLPASWYKSQEQEVYPGVQTLPAGGSQHHIQACAG